MHKDKLDSRRAIVAYEKAHHYYLGINMYCLTIMISICLYIEQGNAKLYIMLRLGEQYLAHGDFHSAKSIYLKVPIFFNQNCEALLKTCSLSPSAFTWLGVGIACYYLENYQEARDALAVRKYNFFNGQCFIRRQIF
jgi:tetratricopeptide (TPR) repeat protein